MLILSRRVCESVMINGEEITITVMAIAGNRVDLGIEAPKAIAVHREEVYRKIQRKERRTMQPTHRRRSMAG